METTSNKKFVVRELAGKGPRLVLVAGAQVKEPKPLSRKKLRTVSGGAATDDQLAGLASMFSKPEQDRAAKLAEDLEKIDNNGFGKVLSPVVNWDKQDAISLDKPSRPVQGDKSSKSGKKNKSQKG